MTSEVPQENNVNSENFQECLDALEGMQRELKRREREIEDLEEKVRLLRAGK